MNAFVWAHPGVRISLNSKTSVLQRTTNRRRESACMRNNVPPNTRVPLLELRDVWYRLPNNYDVQLFRGLNLKVFPNEFVVLIGANGAGKSTLINIMTGLIKLKRRHGTILWDGKVMKPKHLLDNIGLVLQDPASYFFLPTVLDELVMGRPEKTPDDVRRVMAAVGLQNVSLLSCPRSLSGGQVRRLALADQLMRDPRPALFALDEPLAGVDWTGQRQLADLFGSLKRKFAIVIISHEPGELLKYADRVIEVGRGRATEIDPKIVVKAVQVRAERKKAAKAKAQREALEYMKKMECRNQSD